MSGLPLKWVGTVYSGIALDRLPYRATLDYPPYLAFLGRICPEKRPEWAIEVARQAGLPLKIAAKIDPADRRWAETHFLPLLGEPDVEHIGELDDASKASLLGGALAALFPIDWPEPFGLVMAGELACGTPVVALRGGSVEEVLIDGEAPFICRSVAEMVAAIPRLAEIDRAACRRGAERLFSPSALADGYERVYRTITAIGPPEVHPDRAIVLPAGLPGSRTVRPAAT